MMPRLRFPGFEGEWSVVKLGDIAKFSKGTGVSKADINSDGDREAIRYGELYTTYGEVVTKIYSRVISKPSDILSDVNDVLIPSSGETAIDISTATCVEKSGVVIGGDLNIIKTDESGRFLSYYFNHKKKIDIAKLAQGVSVVHLYGSDLKNLNINIPDKQEQKKIADFLTAVDERIELQSNKVEKFQTHKRGLTQKIFTRTLRFKCDDGSDFPEWSTIRLREVLKERKQYATKDSAIEHISLTTSGVVPKSDRYERDFLVVGGDKKYKITELDDICYNPANLKFGVIARNKYGKGIFSPIYVTYCVKNNSPVFFEYYLVRSDFINKVRRYEEGTVYERMAVKSEDFLSEIIFLPCFEEQQKIANFLSRIDEKITLETRKLEELKKFKKALLQRMFV